MSSLSEKHARARETVLKVDGHEFTIRRPLSIELPAWAASQSGAAVRQVVIDYRGPAHDKVASRDPLDGKHVFDGDAFYQWVGDRISICDKIFRHVLAEVEKHQKEVEGQEKKSSPPSP